MKRKSGLLVFFTGCLPGCGQMYLGHMKRGLSLMMLFCSLFALAMFLSLDYLLLFFLPLFLFSFFDSWNLYHLTSQDMAPEDAYLFGLSGADTESLSALFRRHNSLLGWSLVLLGAYALFNTFVGRAMKFLCEYLGEWWLYDVVMQDLPRLVVTVGVIALGVWFIRGPKAPATEDEIPPFVPSRAVSPEADDHAD